MLVEIRIKLDDMKSRHEVLGTGGLIWFHGFLQVKLRHLSSAVLAKLLRDFFSTSSQFTDGAQY